ncbi:MAG: hypothetical protein BM557_11260 [Flavobacterium sp. MedPE-SWcel]|uniref:hypothetical protein n=1 Tax=uncultured Flavobacterium sp. TaxID=165435 RepID=UPI000915F063|nr:hypothetical protein [uncultured Flavobacterium sp.]OIQ15415.1 MAG: hypothetical protein BM557_11260 [Flavobacterium sp. MedPE-SWcel]
MKEIQQIYHNDFGLAFYWIRNEEVLTQRVQLIFKETGFYLLPEELLQFSFLIESTSKKQGCAGCCKEGCGKVLLKTPIKAIDVAVSKQELFYIKDLVKGTLFNLQLNDYINEVCYN